MPNSLQQLPSLQAAEAKKALLAFYQKPVAQVSTELFFTIGAVVFFALFAIRPTILTMSELVKEIEDKRTLDESLRVKAQTLSTVSQQYFAIQDQLPLLDEVIPEQISAEKTLRVIEKVASDNRLIINALRLQSVPAPSDDTTTFDQLSPATIDLLLTVEGEYPAIRAFLDNLYTLSPLMTISSIQFTNTKVTDVSSLLTANFVIQAHYYSATASQAAQEEVVTDLDATL